jgi:hypothetical protein
MQVARTFLVVAVTASPFPLATYPDAQDYLGSGTHLAQAHRAHIAHKKSEESGPRPLGCAEQAFGSGAGSGAVSGAVGGAVGPRVMGHRSVTGDG